MEWVFVHKQMKKRGKVERIRAWVDWILPKTNLKIGKCLFITSRSVVALSLICPRLVFRVPQRCARIFAFSGKSVIATPWQHCCAVALGAKPSFCLSLSLGWCNLAPYGSIWLHFDCNVRFYLVSAQYLQNTWINK